MKSAASQVRALEGSMVEKQRLLRVEEAAAYLGISARTLYNATAPKSKKPFEIKPKRIGKRVLFDVRDLDKWIDAH